MIFMVVLCVLCVVRILYVCYCEYSLNKAERDLRKNFGRWHRNISRPYELFLPEDHNAPLRTIYGKTVTAKGKVAYWSLPVTIFQDHYIPSPLHDKIEAKRKGTNLKAEMKRLLELREGVSKFLGEKI